MDKSETITEKYTCRARNCESIVPPERFMCLKHWRMVPYDLQQAIWAPYRPGQEIGETYLNVARTAINAVADKEATQDSRDDANQDIGSTLSYLSELVEKNGALERVMADNMRVMADNMRMMSELTSAREIIEQCAAAIQAALTLVNGDVELPAALTAARAFLRRA
jgi:hypothetical protein